MASPRQMRMGCPNLLEKGKWMAESERLPLAMAPSDHITHRRKKKGRTGKHKVKAVDLVTGKTTVEYFFDPSLVIFTELAVAKRPSRLQKIRTTISSFSPSNCLCLALSSSSWMKKIAKERLAVNKPASRYHVGLPYQLPVECKVDR